MAVTDLGEGAARAAALSETSLPRRLRPRASDRRSRGTMAQFVREFLSLNPVGWTRRGLGDVLRARPEFLSQFQRNERAFDQMVRRLIERAEIEERDGLLFASERMRLAIAARMELFELNKDAL
jgi:hypothetical protein